METDSRSYLMEVVETQGILFEKVKDYIPGIDVRHFITHYMNSKVRKLIDEGQAYLCTMDSEELFHYFLEFDKYQIKQGEEIGGFLPNWIGQFYAYFQWFYKIPSREVARQIPLDFLIACFAGLHDLDLEVAVKKIGAQLDELYRKTE